MQPSDIERFKQWFHSYAMSFADADGSLPLPSKCKLVHAEDVRKAAVSIALAEGLPERTLLLAEAAALFHDLARFEQFKQFRTFSDRKSFDHGKAAADILLQERVLDSLPASDRDGILTAVNLHNKASLPPDLSKDSMLISMLVRDADKVCILEFMAEYFLDPDSPWKDPAIHLDAPDTGSFSESVMKSALDGGPVLHSDLRCVGDFKLSMFTWPPDLNFSVSASIVLSQCVYQRLASSLPKCDDVDMLLQKAVASLQSLERNGATANAIA